MKTINYAYPSSYHATKLGFAKTGCWFVALCAGAVTPSIQGDALVGFSHAWQAANYADTLPQEYSRYSFQFVRDWFNSADSNLSLSDLTLESALG